MEYIGQLNKATGAVLIVYVPTGEVFYSWESAIEHEATLYA